MGVAYNTGLQGCSLRGLNDWKSPLCVNREKSVIFSRQSSYDILIVKKLNMHRRIVHNKIYIIHLENNAIGQL